MADPVQAIDRFAGDGIGGVLQKVGQGLADLAFVANQFHLIAGKVEFVGDTGVGAPLQDHRAADDIGNVVVVEGRCRHPRKIGKFTDHATDVTDLANNGVYAGRESLGI